MRDRYCVELDLDELLYTVHNQSCLSFPLAELIPHNLVLDLGAHKSSRSALREARRRFVLPWSASTCKCLHEGGDPMRDEACTPVPPDGRGREGLKTAGGLGKSGGSFPFEQ